MICRVERDKGTHKYFCNDQIWRSPRGTRQEGDGYLRVVGIRWAPYCDSMKLGWLVGNGVLYEVLGMRREGVSGRSASVGTVM